MNKYINISILLASLLTGCSRDNTSSSVNDGNLQFLLWATPHIALGYRSTTDTTPPQGTILIEERGGRGCDGNITHTVTGPYTITGSTDPLDAFENRTLTITYNGSYSSARQDSGSVIINAGGQEVTVAVSSLIGDPSLPSDIDWVSDAFGIHATVQLPHAPYPDDGEPWTDSSVFIMIPHGFIDDGHVAIISHFHGFNISSLSSTISVHAYDKQFAMSGRNAILIIPQGPVDAASGSFGKLDQANGMLNLCNDVLAVLYRDGMLCRPHLETTVLTSHDGGYQAIANIITSGGVDISAVHLFDSLYGMVDIFTSFGAEGGLIRSVYTTSSGTGSYNISLRDSPTAQFIQVDSSFDDDTLLLGNHIIGTSETSHVNADLFDYSYARCLRASGLKPTMLAAPVLRYALATDNDVTICWLPDASMEQLNYAVEGSDNNLTWEILSTTTSNSAVVSTRPYIRVRQNTNNALPSDTYGATGRDILIVDSFDRCINGSYNQLTHDFAALVANHLGSTFSIASNEAIAAGEVNMSDFNYVFWLSGDESSLDITFTPQEQAAISDYIEQGGKIIVSGSEIGYATNSSFFNNVLHATYVSDDAGTTIAGDYNFGAAYPEDYPDVISGSATIWSYSTSGAAAVGFNNQVVVVGFPLETIEPDQMSAALSELANYMNE